MASPENKKDAWDIIQIIGTALIPAAIAFAGFFYSNAQKETEIANNAAKNEKEIAVANINASVNQAQLLATFMEPLLSKDSLKQAIAINAILIGVPVQGKQIVDLIARNKSNNKGQQLAVRALNARRTELIHNLYDHDPNTRIGAANDLMVTWLKDSTTISEMVDNIDKAILYPNYYPDVNDGIYNCVVVLKNADRNLLLPEKARLQNILSQIPAANSKTITAMKELLRKID